MERYKSVFVEADKKYNTSKMIADIISTDWGGSNEEQLKIVSMLKGLAISEDKVANDFMKDLDKLTSTMDKEKYKK